MQKPMKVFHLTPQTPLFLGQHRHTASRVVQGVAMQEQLDGVRAELSRSEAAVSQHAASVAVLTRQVGEGEARMEALLLDRESSAAAAVVERQVRPSSSSVTHLRVHNPTTCLNACPDAAVELAHGPSREQVRTQQFRSQSHPPKRAGKHTTCEPYTVS